MMSGLAERSRRALPPGCDRKGSDSVQYADVTLALILVCILSLTFALLLVRQVGLTKRAREDVDAWKRLYEQVRSDRAALLEQLRTPRTQGNASPSQTGAQRKNPERSKPEPRTNRPRAAAAGQRRDRSKEAEPLTLVLPIQLLSKNARDKLHHHARGRLRKQYQEIVELKYPRLEPAPRVKQRATVTRVKGPRERDFDEQNIGAGSAIELMDALTEAGYWVDDSPKWLETVFVQSPGGKVKGPAVVVEVRALH